jgi:hypothetical protein
MSGKGFWKKLSGSIDVPSENLPGRTKRNNNRCPNWGSNPAPPKYEWRASSLRQIVRCFVVAFITKKLSFKFEGKHKIRALNWRTEVGFSLGIVSCQKYYSKFQMFLLQSRNKFSVLLHSCTISLGWFTCFQSVMSLCDEMPITKLWTVQQDR